MSPAHPIRFQQTAEKIVSFRELPTGWHYGNGSAPSGETIQKALKLNSEMSLSGFSKTNAFPGIEGEIQVTAYHGPLYLEFTIESNGEIAYIYERNEEEIECKEKLDLETAIQIIRHFRGQIWALSVSFIESTMTPIREFSKALPSSRPVMEVESQSLTMSAFPKEGSAFANTLTDSIKTLQASRRYFGKFQPTNFLKITGLYSAPVQPAMSATTT